MSDREKFEVFILAERGPEYLTRRTDDEEQGYADDYVQEAWETWQARDQEVAALQARIKELEARCELVDRLRQEAQIHAQEARTANSTLAEIYQLVTGGTGEPGNWNGAEPVRQYMAQVEARFDALQAEREVQPAEDEVSLFLEQGAPPSFGAVSDDDAMVFLKHFANSRQSALYAFSMKLAQAVVTAALNNHASGGMVSDTSLRAVVDAFVGERQVPSIKTNKP